MKQGSVFWCTGMSGVGKSTLASYAKNELEEKGKSVLILDGDVVRDNYRVKLGFDRQDVKKNNFNVAKICSHERKQYDLLIVPIISPIETVRRKLREILSPNYHLIYITAKITSLRERDTKKLYEKADQGKITDLIGYSVSNPYDIPTDYDLKIDTSNPSDIEKCKNEFVEYLLNYENANCR